MFISTLGGVLEFCLNKIDEPELFADPPNYKKMKQNLEIKKV